MWNVECEMCEWVYACGKTADHLIDIAADKLMQLNDKDNDGYVECSEFSSTNKFCRNVTCIPVLRRKQAEERARKAEEERLEAERKAEEERLRLIEEEKRLEEERLRLVEEKRKADEIAEKHRLDKIAADEAAAELRRLEANITDDE